MIASFTSQAAVAPPPNARIEITERSVNTRNNKVSLKPTRTASTETSSREMEEVIQATAPRYNLDINENKTWSKRNERRFLDLARKEALDQITESETQELERLERMRNALNAKRTYQEILASKRQFEKAEKLITALHEYLEATH